MGNARECCWAPRDVSLRCAQSPSNPALHQTAGGAVGERPLVSANVDMLGSRFHRYYLSSLIDTRFTSTAAAALAVIVPAVAGTLAPDYSHTANYISELGAIGMPRGGLVSFAGFLPTGLIVGACLAAGAARAGVTGSGRIGFFLLMSVALAYIGAAFARCDLGCPAQGSVRQQIHNLLGVAEYVGGSAGLMFVSRGLPQEVPLARRGVLALAGIVTLVAFVFMASPDIARWRGLAQRVAETALFGSLLLIGWQTTMIHVPSRGGGR